MPGAHASPRTPAATAPWLCAIVAATLACADESSVVALPVLADDVASWVIGVGNVGTEDLVLYAADAAHPVRVAAASGPQALELVAYRDDLATLGLTAGRLTQAKAGEASRALPHGDAYYAAIIDAGRASAWDPLLDAQRLAELRLITESPCLTLAPTVEFLPTTRDVAWAVSLDRDTVLAGVSQPLAMLLRVGQAPQQLDVNPATAQPRSAFRAADGHIWLGDVDGGLWRGTLELDRLDLVRMVETSSLGAVRSLDGDPSDPEHQLFTLSHTGTVARFETDAWVVVDRLPHPLGGDNMGGLGWLGPDELIVGNASLTVVRTYRRGVITDVSLSERQIGTTGVVRIGPREVAVGMSTGVVALFRDEAWLRIGRGGLALDLFAFIPWEDGFVYGGTAGFVGQWGPANGFCSVDASPIASGTVRFLLPFGDDIMAIGDSRTGAINTGYTLLSTARR